jgi:hypothetical protein
MGEVIRMAKKPRQKKLPTMEDTAIKPLETAALDYVEVRDERMGLSKRESKAKSKVLAEMKRAGKTKYVRDGLSVEVIREAETVKVRRKASTEASA